MKIPNFWKNKNLFSYILLPLALLWYIASKFRSFISIKYQPNSFIICIGNYVVGGGGKTPTAIALCQKLQQANPDLRIFLAYKSYKSKCKKAISVDIKKHTPLKVGDEPLLASNYCKVVVAPSRKQALKLANKQKASIVIMDDGLQNPTFVKDYSILLINDLLGIKNKFLIPAGPLRETLSSALSKVQACISFNTNITNNNNDLKNFSHNKLLLNASTVVLNNNIDTKSEYLAFCGIANPQKFLNSLKQKNIKVCKFLTYTDHHQYTKQEIIKILDIAKQHNYKIITTEKDFVKIPNQYHDLIEVLKIETQIEQIDVLTKNILEEYKNHNHFRETNNRFVVTKNNIVNLLLGFLAYFLYYSIQILPFKLVSLLGKFLGENFLYNYLPSRRNYGINSLQITFPEKSLKEIHHIYKTSCGILARNMMELIKINSMIKNPKMYNIKDPYKSLEFIENNSALMFSAHIGNWEMVALSFLKCSVKTRSEFFVVFKDPKNKYVKNLLKKVRSYLDAKEIVLNRSSLLLLNKEIKNNNCKVLMFADQKVTSGLIVDFLGRPASTTHILPMLSVKHNIPMIPIRVIRNNDLTFDIILEKPIYPTITGNKDKDIYNLTKSMNDIISSWIMEHPEQWLWSHRRWQIHASVANTNKNKKQ